MISPYAPTSLIYAASDGKHRPASHPVYGGNRPGRSGTPPALLTAEIRYLRERMGLTQRQLADKIGVTRVAVSWWESGKQPPSREHYAALVRVLLP